MRKNQCHTGREEPMKKPEKKQRFNGMAAIGMGFGLMFGILLENLPLGLLVGAALAGFGNMTTQR